MVRFHLQWQNADVTTIEIPKHLGINVRLAFSILGSRHANMKELRPPAGSVRILFAFDPRRAAILLIGGDKTNQWRKWYDQMVPVADQLYDEHLAMLENEENKR